METGIFVMYNLFLFNALNFIHSLRKKHNYVPDAIR